MPILDCDTVFNEHDNTMIQTFENGMQLIYCRKTFVTGVFFNGELKERYENLSIPEYTRLQIKVHALKTVQ
jgi:hypothetical protein